MSWCDGLARLALLVVTASACSRAEAGPPPVAKAAPRASHTSPLGTNLAFIADWGTEWPFVDLMKQSRAWISANTDGRWDDGRSVSVDARGWPTQLLPGQIARTLAVWDVDAPPGNYVVTWKGKGSLTLQPQQPTSMAAQRATFTLGSTRGIAVGITATDPTDPIRDIRIVPAAYDNKPDAFQAEFLHSLKAFSVLRFMDWMRTNDPSHPPFGKRVQPDHRSYVDGVPPEVMVELCNTLGAEPWFTVPHDWSDGDVRAFATLVRDRLKPELKVWVEHSNEIWNDAFPQARWVHGRGGALSSDAFEGRLRFHGKRTVEIVKIWEDVFGAQGARVVGVAGSQAANAWVSDQVLSAKDSARHIDALAIAPYFGGTLGEPDRYQQTRTMGSADVHAAVAKEVDVAIGWTRESKKIADKHGVALVAYEGGQHLVGVGGAAVNDDQLTFVLQRSQGEPQMKQHYLRFLAGWKAAGGTTFVHYTSTLAPGKHGAWGARDSVLQPRAQAPKYDALLTFVEQTPRWW